MRNNRHTAILILAILVVSIFAAELVIMFALYRIITPSLNLFDALLDSSLLIVVLFPVLYFLTYRPLLVEIAQRKRAVEELRESHDELEKLIRERTAELSEANRRLQTECAEREELLEKLRKANAELVFSNLRVQEQAEVARRRASQLQAIIESIADGVFVCDKEGRIADVNATGLKLLGLARREDATLPLADYLHTLNLRHANGQPVAPEDLSVWRALRGETVSGLEEVARSPQARRDIFLLVSAAPIRDREGNIVGAVEVISDITRIRELDKLKDEFISVAAHELKTPVAIMKGYAQALLRVGESIPPPHLNMLEAINRGADRIDRIVKDLLDISRLHLGHLELSMDRIDLPEMVEQVGDRIARTTTRHRVRVVRSEPAIVKGDRDRLEQSLINLIDNAIKYSPKGGDVEVAVEVRDREAVVSVKDHGVGIPRDKQPHIFERFYRAHSGTPYDYGGMGVGLYISREIVLRHGGRMWFESEEGEGSTFYIGLPLE